MAVFYDETISFKVTAAIKKRLFEKCPDSRFRNAVLRALLEAYVKGGVCVTAQREIIVISSGRKQQPPIQD